MNQDRPCNEDYCDRYSEILEHLEDSFAELPDQIADVLMEFAFLDIEQYNQVKDSINQILTDSLKYILNN